MCDCGWRGRTTCRRRCAVTPTSRWCDRGSDGHGLPVQGERVCTNEGAECFNESAECFNESATCFNESTTCFNESATCFNDSAVWFNDSAVCFNESAICLNDSAVCFNESAVASTTEGCASTSQRCASTTRRCASTTRRCASTRERRALTSQVCTLSGRLRDERAAAHCFGLAGHPGRACGPIQAVRDISGEGKCRPKKLGSISLPYQRKKTGIKSIGNFSHGMNSHACRAG